MRSERGYRSRDCGEGFMNDRDTWSTRPIHQERRHSQRYAVCAPALFRWSERNGPEYQGAGFTQNMSAQGTYITVNGEFPDVETYVTVEIQLPPLDAQVSGLVLKAKGCVVRAGNPAERNGFAVKTNFDAAEGT